MTWKDDLAEQMRADAAAILGNLPADQQPGDDDRMECGLAGPTGAMLTLDDLTTMDKYVRVGAETVRLRPLETGLLEVSAWKDGKMIHLEHRRRKAGKRPQVND